MTNVSDKVEYNSISEGLMDMTLPGKLYQEVELSNKARKILLKLITEDEENTSVLFSDQDELSYENFMRGITWLKKKLEKNSVNKLKIRFDIIIANELQLFVKRHRNNKLSFEKDFDIAMQWVTNFWSKKYSIFELNRKMELHQRSKKLVRSL